MGRDIITYTHFFNCNAIRHGDNSKEIKLILKAEHGSAVLSVINAGAEIPLEKRAQLF